MSESKKMVKYELTGEHYRLGRLYRAGETISIPEGEKPGKTWKPLEPVKTEAVKPVASK